MKKTTLILVAGLIAGCDSSNDPETSGAVDIPHVSSNSLIQNAYGKCVQETRKELREDNPSLPNDVMSSLYQGANQTCHSAVVITCERGLDDSSCKLILDMYQ